MSEHFTLRELTRSDYAARHNISNEPMPRIVENIELVLMPGLEQVRALLKHPMHISSGFRTQALNDAIGGSLTSQHRYGLAADFTCDRFGSPFEVCKAIESSDIQFDQLIHEYGQWVHISFVRNAPRRSVLSIFNPGRYMPGIRQR
jgi:hypothetical protein